MYVLLGALVGALLAGAGAWVSPRWTSQGRRWWEYVAAGAAGALLGGLMAYKLAGLSAAFFFYVVLAAVLITASLVDLHDRIIPNELVLFALGAGLLLRGIVTLSRVPPETVAPWPSGLGGALLGFGLLFLLGLLYRGGMGMGDVKLAGAIGLYLGFTNTAVGLMVAFILGGLASLVLLIAGAVGRKDHIPFGPFLAAGALMAVLWSTEILRYLGLAW